MAEDLLPGALATLQATPAVLSSLLTSLGQGLIETPADGEWSPRDVAAHLLVSEEKGAMSRLRTILATENPPLPGYDEQAELERSGLRTRPLQAILEEFALRRRANIELLRSLESSALRRTGEHLEVGKVTVAELIYHAAYHDCLHIRQIVAMLQATYEPLRGPMRAF